MVYRKYGFLIDVLAFVWMEWLSISFSVLFLAQRCNILSKFIQGNNHAAWHRVSSAATLRRVGFCPMCVVPLLRFWIE